MARPQTSVDLERERARASFDVRELTYLLHGGKERVELKERMAREVAADPALDPTHVMFMSHTDHYLHALGRNAYLYGLRRRLKISAEENDALFAAMPDYNGPLGAHVSVFIAAVRTQASQEQLDLWMPLIEHRAISGCYAQTELAHGSNVQALMTTATFVPESDEFDLHTPSLEATKWWIGDLMADDRRQGKTATHAVVYARLLSRGTDYGVHAFMVQLRSLQDHTPLPGIRVGDIGPKHGFNGADNGYLQLSHVRIPRFNMLSRHSQVTADGTYVRPKHAKLGYGGMLAVRAIFVNTAASSLAKAATIAVRYSAVRRQGGAPGQESQILDYAVQQYRLLPLVAATYAFRFTGQYMTRLLSKLEGGDNTALPEVHAASAGLKSFCSTLAADGMEDARKCCGGHGYSKFSGLPELVSTYLLIYTGEGENYLMTQQTTRYLLKQREAVRHASGAAKVQLSSQLAYLTKTADELARERSPVRTGADWRRTDVQRGALAHVTARLLQELAAALAAAVQGGQSAHDAWNAHLVEVYNVSMAHCRSLVVDNFITAVDRLRVERPGLYPVLKRLSDLFALHGLEKNLVQLVEDGFVNGQQAALLREEVRTLLAEVRPDAVALVDAWNFPDTALGSAIGRADGRVYETLFELAQREPLNATPVPPFYDTTLRPLLKAGQAASGFKPASKL